jgi:hypothetical protein
VSTVQISRKKSPLLTKIKKKYLFAQNTLLSCYFALSWNSLTKQHHVLGQHNFIELTEGFVPPNQRNATFLMKQATDMIALMTSKDPGTIIIT